MVERFGRALRPNGQCFSGGRHAGLSGRAIRQQAMGRDRGLSNRSSGRPSVCKHVLGRSFLDDGKR